VLAELRASLSHPMEVYCVAFSPDGVILASASNEVRLWDSESGALRATLKGHDKNAVSLAFARDQTLLASTDFSAIRLWNVATGEQVDSIHASSGGWVHCIAFSPDAKTMASVANDSHLRRWDVKSGRELSAFRNRGNLMETIAFSPDGSKLVFAIGSMIHLWDAATLKEEYALKRHRAKIKSVKFSPDGLLLAFSGYDSTIKICDVESCTLLRTLKGHKFRVWDVDFSPDSRLLASAGWDATVNIWDATNGSHLLTLPSENKCVYSVAFSPDGNMLAAGGNGKTVQLWNLKME